jgi:hypothetical protein
MYCGVERFIRWLELILDKDAALFGTGNTTYDQLSLDAIVMPTEEEIEDHIIIARKPRTEDNLSQQAQRWIKRRRP